MMIKRTIFATLLVGAASFVPLSTPPARHHAVMCLDAQKRQADLGLARFFGLVATVSVLSFGDVPAVQASVTINESRKSSTSRLWGISG